MDERNSYWHNVVVGIVCLAAFITLFVILGKGLQSSDNAIKLPLLVITGVMALLATLALVAVSFSVAGLADKTQALGLPEGSVRAVIALSLIVIFATTAVFFHASMTCPNCHQGEAVAAGPTPGSGPAQPPSTSVGPDQPPSPSPAPTRAPANTPADDFAKQVFTIVGTLMTSVVSFYFASRTGAAAAVPPKFNPKLASISPHQGKRGVEIAVMPVTIAGTDLQLAKTVKLEKGADVILATNVTSNELEIHCTLTLAATAALGQYDVTVTTSDNQTATLPKAFDVVA